MHATCTTNILTSYTHRT